MKKDLPDWREDDWIENAGVVAMGAVGVLAALLALFWLAAIFELIP